MSEKTIEQRVQEKRDKLIEIHGVMAIHLSKELSPKQKQEAKVLQDRLEYRILAAEEQLLDAKIDIYQQTLDIIKRDDFVFIQ